MDTGGIEWGGMGWCDGIRWGGMGRNAMGWEWDVLGRDGIE